MILYSSILNKVFYISPVSHLSSHSVYRHNNAKRIFINRKFYSLMPWIIKNENKHYAIQLKIRERSLKSHVLQTFSCWFYAETKVLHWLLCTFSLPRNPQFLNDLFNDRSKKRNVLNFGVKQVFVLNQRFIRSFFLSFFRQGTTLILSCFYQNVLGTLGRIGLIFLFLRLLTKLNL